MIDMDVYNIYDQFIDKKGLIITSSGISVKKDQLTSNLFDYEKDIVKWALAKGRAAIFADCGLGKTIMQLEWARQVLIYTNNPVLIVAPLAVASQTKNEGQKFGISVNICNSQHDIISDCINITNYEKLDKFIGCKFSAIVLDESSILKSYSGKIRNQIIEMFKDVQYKLACTATPAPNDFMELGNHSEFLNIMPRKEMLSTFFVHNGGETSKWRLKGHAEDLFWKWIAGWSIVLDNPKDLGYTDKQFVLPEIIIDEIIVDGDSTTNLVQSLTDRRRIRRESIKSRCEYAANIINQSNEQWLVWCDLNDESDLLNLLISDSVNVQGSDNLEFKASSMLNFANKKFKCLITKPKIGGFGMNWQNCHNVMFVGISDSFESYYQSIRRCWRYGQQNSVNVKILISCKDGAVKSNIERKQFENSVFRKNMIKYTKDTILNNLQPTCRVSIPYNPKVKMILPNWEEFKHENCIEPGNK